MCPARRCGVSNETILQVGLVLLCVVLAVLAWSSLVGVFTLAG